MSISKELWGQTRLVPETDETGWGNEVTEQLGDMLDVTDAFSHLDSSDNIHMRLQATVSSLGAGATLTPTSPVHKVAGAAAAVTLAGITAGAKDGQQLVLIGTDSTNTVTVSNSATVLLNGHCVLEEGDVLRLQYSLSALAWVEVGRNT